MCFNNQNVTATSRMQAMFHPRFCNCGSPRACCDNVYSSFYKLILATNNGLTYRHPTGSEILAVRIIKTHTGSGGAHTNPSQIALTEVPFFINVVYSSLCVNAQNKVSLQFLYFTLQKGSDECESREKVCICVCSQGRGTGEWMNLQVENNCQAPSRNCEKRLLDSSCLSIRPSVCLSACNHSGPTRRIFMRFNT